MMLTMTCLLVSNQESNGVRAETLRGRPARKPCAGGLNGGSHTT